MGYDEGTILIKMGRDEPAVTMDVNGKLIWARHSELCQGKICLNILFYKEMIPNERPQISDIMITFSNSPWYGFRISSGWR